MSTDAVVDRWIPGYAEVGLSFEEARSVARGCQSLQDEGDRRPWTEILADEVAMLEERREGVVR